MRGSDYAELRAFAAIVENGTFAKAATQLGISASALSQTIRGLEDRLGVRLLNRTTRSVAPTEAGTRLIERLLPAMEEIETAVADAQALSEKPSGLLRINTPRVAAQDYLGPLATRFHRAYPDIVLEMVIEDRLVDIVGDRSDAGIRLGETVEKDMISLKLGRDISMAVLASPDYLARRGTPQTPRELQEHSCVSFRWPDGSLYNWEFERGAEKFTVAVTGPLIVTDADVILRVLLEGIGIGVMFDYQVEEHVKAGRLVRLLQQWTPPFPGFHLYYPSRRQMPPALRAFVDFVKGEARA